MNSQEAPPPYNELNGMENITIRNDTMEFIRFKDVQYPPWMVKVSEQLALSFGEAQVTSAKLKQKIMAEKNFESNSTTRDEMRKHRNEYDSLMEKWEKGSNLLLQQITTFINLAKDDQLVPATGTNPSRVERSSRNNTDRNNSVIETAKEAVAEVRTPLLAIVDLVDLRRYMGHWRVDTKQQRSNLTALYGPHTITIKEMDRHFFEHTLKYGDGTCKTLRWRADGVNRDRILARGERIQAGMSAQVIWHVETIDDLGNKGRAGTLMMVNNTLKVFFSQNRMEWYGDYVRV